TRFAGLQALAEFTQRGAQLRGVGAVPRGAAFSMAGAFERGKMVCHVALLNPVKEIFQEVSPKDLFYLGLAPPVNSAYRVSKADKRGSTKQGLLWSDQI